MQFILFVLAALAASSQADYPPPEQPHTEYGVPVAYLAKTTQESYLDVSKKVLPVEEPINIAPPRDSYGIAKEYDEYETPILKPAATLETSYNYHIPHIIPISTLENEAPKDPHEVLIKPTHDYGIPHFVVPEKPREQYEAVNYIAPVAPTNESGNPTVSDQHEGLLDISPEKPHGEYTASHSVEDVAPIVTHFDYFIPHIAPAAPAKESGVLTVSDEHEGLLDITPEKSHGEYAASHSVENVAPIVTHFDYFIPHVAPVAPANESGIPTVSDEHEGLLDISSERPHGEYAASHAVEDVAPIVTHFDYFIPHIAPAAPAKESGVLTVSDEHEGLLDITPEKSHGEYAASHSVENVAPIVTHFDYFIPHVAPVAPANESGIPTVSDEHEGLLDISSERPHGEYAASHAVEDVAPIVTHFDYFIPHVAPAHKYEVLTVPNEHEGPLDVVPEKPHEEYGIPNYVGSLAPPNEHEAPLPDAPEKPHEEYGAPTSVEHVAPVSPSNEHGIPNVPDEHEGPLDVAPEKPHEEYETSTSVAHVAPVAPTNEYGIPNIPDEHEGPLDVVPDKPHEEYGIPDYITPIAPGNEDGVPKVPNEHEVPVPVAPEKPGEEYGAPNSVEHVAPVAPSNEDGIPNVPDEHEGPLDVAPEKPHEEYGVPKVPIEHKAPLSVALEKPREAYEASNSVENIAPIITHFDYFIPHIAPAAPINKYEVPQGSDQHEISLPVAPENSRAQYEALNTVKHVAPVAPVNKYDIPNVPNEHQGPLDVAPEKSHEEYRAPQSVENIAPVVTHFDFYIPHVAPVAPAHEYEVQNVPDEHTGPLQIISEKPLKEYEAPHYKEHAVPIVPQFNYYIPHIVAPTPQVQHESTIPRVTKVLNEPVVVPHSVYGVPNIY